MKNITLDEKCSAIVDDDDFERLSKIKWYFGQNRVRRTIESEGYRGTQFMHSVVMGEELKKGFVIDHINGNTLDNRKENLRICTFGQNQMNRFCKKNKKTSRYKGVFSESRTKAITWRARIVCNKKAVHLGTFKTEIEAAGEYNNAAKRLFGEYARLNNVGEGGQKNG